MLGFVCSGPGGRTVAGHGVVGVAIARIGPPRDSLALQPAGITGAVIGFMVVPNNRGQTAQVGHLVDNGIGNVNMVFNGLPFNRNQCPGLFKYTRNTDLISCSIAA